MATKKRTGKRPTEEQAEPGVRTAPEPEPQPTKEAKPAPENPAGEGKVAIAMGFWSDHFRHDRPDSSIESDLAAYIGFLGEKYGVGIRAATFHKKGRKELVHVSCVIERRPVRVTEGWQHSSGKDWIASKWEPMT